jgi:hypothetical protein
VAARREVSTATHRAKQVHDAAIPELESRVLAATGTEVPGQCLLHCHPESKTRNALRDRLTVLQRVERHAVCAPGAVGGEHHVIGCDGVRNQEAEPTVAHRQLGAGYLTAVDPHLRLEAGAAIHAVDHERACGPLDVDSNCEPRRGRGHRDTWRLTRTDGGLEARSHLDLDAIRLDNNRIANSFDNRAAVAGDRQNEFRAPDERDGGCRGPLESTVRIDEILHPVPGAPGFLMEGDVGPAVGELVDLTQDDVRPGLE